MTHPGHDKMGYIHPGERAKDPLCLRLSSGQSTAKNDKSTVLQIVRDRPIVVATVS